MSPRAAAPSYVQFYPTLRCNLSCDFCFNRGLTPVADVDQADFRRMLDRLRAAGIETLDLLGGEPTLHPRLEELLGAIAERGMRTTLSTGGLGGLDLLERLEDRFGRETLRVGVSLNHADPPARLGEYLARRAPLVKSVCTRDRTLPGLPGHLGPEGEGFFLIFRDPVERGDLAACLSYPEYARRLAALRRTHPRAAGVACDGFVPGGPAADPARAARCPAGTTKLSVLPDGSVYPCYLLFSRREFRLGNLLTDDFATIWAHPRLEFFRTFRGNACPRLECEHHPSCHGGCPAVSLLVSGDLEAPDPRCVRPQRATSAPGRSGCRRARRA